MRAGLVGLSLSDAPGRGWYLPLAHTEPPGPDPMAPRQPKLALLESEEKGAPTPALAPDNLPREETLDRLRRLFGGAAVKAAHNAKYDLVVLSRHGVEVADPLYDTMIAAWVAEPARRAFGLKELAWSKLGVSMTAIRDVIGTGKEVRSMAHVPVADAADYACGDVDATMRLYEVLRDDVSRRDGDGLFMTVEMPMVRVLADMERTGVLVDRDRLAAIDAELTARLAELEDEIYAITGSPFNIGSPQQLGQVLFEQLKIPRGKKTQSGYSTAADTLTGLEAEYPIVSLVLEWRHLSKLKGTYVDTLPNLINPTTGRVHTSFQQTAVVTGRISSTDPNLQNIPVRTEQGGQIRSAFVAPKGSVLVSADYSQMELRVLAHLSGDQTLAEIFAGGGDIHDATGAFLYGKAPEDVSAEDRRIAKVVNFGVLYGMGAFGLADRTGLSRAEAAEFIERYFKTYAQVRVFFDELLERAAETGYVETILGRRRYFPELRAGARVDRNAWQRARREAVNAPIQGSAADVMKVAMIRVHEDLRARALPARMLLQVHDELILEADESALEEVVSLTVHHMKTAVPMTVDLAVDVYTGSNWLDLAPYRPGPEIER
jgi:DNA polymerase-1